MSTERLYYDNSFLYDFSAKIVDVKELKRDGSQSVWALKLDRTAFYPTSGGQPFDTGHMIAESKSGIPLEAAVADVFEDEQGEIWHATEKVLPPGASVRGQIDSERRRDHMQQHTGQHLLSAAFISLFNAKTVSFHLGEQTSTIDLEISSLNRDDLVKVERLANEIIAEDRPISVRYASRDEAQRMGVRKLPERTGEIRLIDIQDFDLNACGGTHARSTGQIGGMLIRKTEKVRQGMRVEFVCGLRAVRIARQDFELLANAAALYPCAPADLPGNIGRQREEARQVQKREAQLLDELAGFKAEHMLRTTQPDQDGRTLIVEQFADRDAAFVKLLAQKLTRRSKSVIALLASPQPSPTLVFARSSNLSPDMGTLLRELVIAFGGRGGGGKDFAQGGVPDQSRLPELLETARQRVQSR